MQSGKHLGSRVSDHRLESQATRPSIHNTGGLGTATTAGFRELTQMFFCALEVCACVCVPMYACVCGHGVRVCACECVCICGVYVCECGCVCV